MIAARYVHTATLLSDGRVLVAGGHPGLGSVSSLGLPLAAIGLPLRNLGLPLAALPPQASAELYDPATGSWAATGAMIEARVGGSATLLGDGTVLVAGGSGDAASGDPGLASAERYNPNTGSWTPAAQMSTVRYGHTATLLPNGTVLVAGGLGGGEVQASAELFDPSTRAWTPTAAMIEPRTFHTATLLLDGTVLVAGGSGALATAERYDPATRSWTATAGMVEARTNHTATRLTNGRVLVAGGFVSSGPEGSTEASAELYDPDTGTWTATGRMIDARQSHTATLLPDGTVLVAGDGAPASAELYDPSSGFWNAAAPMAEARANHTATLLRDGTVLVAGGSSSVGALATAELYDPGSGS